MNKSIYLAALASFALTAACSSDSDSVFDKSAADRLEQYKKDYADVLTADGGLWTMEYFSNDEEPGYLFIMKFNPDGSVKIGANHKWIGNSYKEETSLWQMIADNGPVLSFSSYNDIFHIFSDPANITGSDAPKGEQDEDINETGYGHNGDYEFQVMDVSDDLSTVRLLGKKRLIDIYLRRLDASTSMQAYMDAYKQLESSLFAKEIPNLKFTDADGQTYMVNGCNTGVMSIYPEAGDKVEQTRSGNFIITNSGIRFMVPLEYVTATGEEKLMSELVFVGNKSLAFPGMDDAVLNAGSFCEVMTRNTRNWKIDTKAFAGSLKSSFDEFNEELKTLYNYKSASVQDLAFEYDQSLSAYVMKVFVKISSKGNETYKFLTDFSESDSSVRVFIGDSIDKNSGLALNAYTKLQKLFSEINNTQFRWSSKSDCGPKSIVLSSGEDSMSITAL